MVEQRQITRRALIAAALLGGGLAATSIPTAVSQPAPTPAIRVDPALLQPATEPATWDVEKNYSTETVPPAPPTEYCDLKFFPDVPASDIALSGVVMANDLSASPNMVLVQQFVFTDEATAAADFAHVRDETRALAAAKYFLPGPEALVVFGEEPGIAIDIHAAPNGTGYALLSVLAGNAILTLRAGAVQAEPPVAALQAMSQQIIAQGPLQATPFSTAEDAPAVEHAAYAVNWELPAWHWNYGPLDIHPARYVSPICTPGE